jgi:hypothetical protein
VRTLAIIKVEVQVAPQSVAWKNYVGKGITATLDLNDDLAPFVPQEGLARRVESNLCWALDKVRSPTAPGDAVLVPQAQHYASPPFSDEKQEAIPPGVAYIDPTAKLRKFIGGKTFDEDFPDRQRTIFSIMVNNDITFLQMQRWEDFVEFLQHKAEGAWLFSDSPAYSGTGRTYVLALGYLWLALQYPGAAVPIFDHWGRISSIQKSPLHRTIQEFLSQTELLDSFAITLTTILLKSE